LYRTSVLEPDCDISQASDKEALATAADAWRLFLGTADLQAAFLNASYQSGFA
jgi:hypothetical protein